AELSHRQAFAHYLAPVQKQEWVVYAKRPFAGPQQVIDYVGRYTHRVAISNNRLLGIRDNEVSFAWKDYRHHDQQKRMTLAADEFIRRFLLHVLPDGFQRIRYYGLLGNRLRKQKLSQCRQLLGMASLETRSGKATVPEDYRDRFQKTTNSSLRECPVCHCGQMVLIETLTPLAANLAIPDTS